MDVVCAANAECERKREGEVGRCAGVEVQSYDSARICDDGFEFDSVDERFREGGELEWCVVEAVNVVPDCTPRRLAIEYQVNAMGRLTAYLLIFVLPILNASHEDRGLVWEYEALAIFPQIPVSCPQDCVEHALV